MLIGLVAIGRCETGSRMLSGKRRRRVSSSDDYRMTVWKTAVSIARDAGLVQSGADRALTSAELKRHER